MKTQRIIDWFRFSAICWDWTRVNTYYAQYPQLGKRFDRELSDLGLN
jgi:hypothetical protein